MYSAIALHYDQLIKFALICSAPVAQFSHSSFASLHISRLSISILQFDFNFAIQFCLCHPIGADQFLQFYISVESCDFSHFGHSIQFEFGLRNFIFATNWSFNSTPIGATLNLWISGQDLALQALGTASVGVTSSSWTSSSQPTVI